MNATSYQKLAQHLDQLPGGFSSSDSKADMRLLQSLFTPQEAELSTFLTLEREPAHIIAERAGLPLEETQQRLDEMSSKGLIFSIHKDGSSTLYQAVPFVIGIYEFQVNKLDKSMLRDLLYYWRARDEFSNTETIPQIRTIPIEKSIDPQLEVFSYEQAHKLIDSQDRFAVAPCICRRSANILGRGCNAPEESCLVFGDWADYYVRDGRGRSIDKIEVIQILAKADEANLVLQPGNSQDSSFICCCCGCCCGVLGDIKNHPKPAERVSNAFIAQFDADLCIGCWICLDRCQMDALSEDVDVVALNQDRCIGCGLCVSTCSTGALTLVRKPVKEQPKIPETMEQTWKEITRT